MRISLIAPPRLPHLRTVKASMPPTSLLYLASALRTHGHSPSIHDLSLYPELAEFNSQKLPKTVLLSLENSVPELFAINCLTTLHFQSVVRITQTLRNAFPGIPIMLGGAHPSLFPEDILKNCPFVDYIIVGEGENIIVELLNSISYKADIRDLSHIQSLAYRTDGKIFYNPRKNFITDLDSLSNPAWDLINISDYYSDHSEWHNPKKLSFQLGVPILTSRSCPFSCSFCAAHATMGRQYRMRSPKRVVDEIQFLHEYSGENYFSFLDDNVNLNKSHILDICSEICKRGLNIQFETLSGIHLGSLDHEVIDALDQAGLVFVRLPIEHGNDWIRNKVIGKQLNKDKIYDVCKYFKNKPNIRTANMFIMGFPEDTFETLEDTRKMILELQLDLNLVFNLLPFPGTKIFSQAFRDGLLLHNYNPDRLWAGETSLDPTEPERDFFLKPYDMSLEELMTYRKIFDQLRILPNSRILHSPR